MAVDFKHRIVLTQQTFTASIDSISVLMCSRKLSFVALASQEPLLHHLPDGGRVQRPRARLPPTRRPRVPLRRRRRPPRPRPPGLHVAGRHGGDGGPARQGRPRRREGQRGQDVPPPGGMGRQPRLREAAAQPQGEQDENSSPR